MFEYLKLRWRLKRLIREQDANDRSYNQCLKELRERGASNDDMLSLSAEASLEDSLIRLRINELVTKYWLRKAERRFLATPERKEGQYWEESPLDHRLYLTSEGVSHIRSAVRTEVKASREIIAILGATATGIIGATTGLIALLLQWVEQSGRGNP